MDDLQDFGAFKCRVSGSVNLCWQAQFKSWTRFRFEICPSKVFE